MKKEEKKIQKQINLQFFAAIYFLLFLIAIVFNEEKPFLKFPKLGPNFGRDMTWDILLGTLVGLLIVGISWILNRQSKAFRELVQSFRKILGYLNTTEIFFVAAFSSLAEEFFFRGLIQGYFGIFFASMLFGLLHTGPGKKYLPWTIFAISMGFILGGLYEWRGNLALPVVIHFIVNFLNLHLMMRKKIHKTNVTNI